MSRHQVRLLLCSTASVALIVGALFVLEWFRIDLGAKRISIELQTARICDDAGCKMIGLRAMSGFYPIVAAVAFWCGLPLALLVLGQFGAKMITGSATVLASKLGYFIAAVVFLCAFGAGYLFAPETDELFHTMGGTIIGTPAPAMLLAGSLFAILALRYAITDGRNETDGEYKPVVLDGNDPRLPITPLNIQVVSSTGRIPTPQRERIITPGPTDRIAGSGPGPRDRVPTPGSFERIPLPGHRDRAPTGGGPGPRERAPTGGGPGPRERAATGGGMTGPGPRDRVPTPGSFERIPLPGHRDRASKDSDRAIASPGPRDRVPTPGSFERIPLPGHRDRARAGSDGDRAATVPRERAATGDSDRIVTTPGPRERAATGNDSDRIATAPGPRGRVPTADDLHRAVTSDGLREHARSESDSDRIGTSPGPRGRVPTADNNRIGLRGEEAQSQPDDDYIRLRDSIPDDELDQMELITPTPGPERRPSAEPAGVGPTATSGRARTSSEQPLVARTTSPSRTGGSSEQPLVARTTSPSGRARTSSEQPLVARTSSSQLGSGTSLAASGDRAKSSSQPGSGTSSSADRTKSPSQPGSGTSSSADRTKSPSQPGSGTSLAATGDRTKSPSQPGERIGSSPQLGDRTRSPSQDRLKAPSQPGDRDRPFAAADARLQDEPIRPRTSSSGPIDLAARLNAAPIAIAIKPPLPAPIPVPPDQIPVAPESGLVIRKRTPSAAPLTGHQLPPAPRALSPLSTSGAMASTVPVVIRPRSSTASGKTPPGAMPSIGLRSVVDDMSGLATKTVTPPLAIPVVGADAYNVELEPKRATPPRAMPAVEVDVMTLELAPRHATPPLAMPVVDADVPISFEPTPLPIGTAVPAAREPAAMHDEAAARVLAAAREETAARLQAAARDEAAAREEAAAQLQAAARDEATAREQAAVRDAAAARVQAAAREQAAARQQAAARERSAAHEQSSWDSSDDLLRTKPRINPVRLPSTPATHPLVGKLSFAVASAKLTSIGITAQREDGSQRDVVWESIVGIIARRLPNESPYDGTTFVDLVSESGATLRFLPWTDVQGAPVYGEGEERARALVQLVAMRCLDAKLDSWTKVFADGSGHAAQLPTAKTLAAHDERLA